MAVETHPMQTKNIIKPSRGIGYKRVKAINREIVFGILILLALLYGAEDGCAGLPMAAPGLSANAAVAKF